MSKALKIDKSKFNAEQLAQYEELVAIGKADVDPEAAEEEVEDEKPPVPPKKKTEKAEVDDVEDTKKSAPEEVAPEIKKALDEVAELKKSIEMSQMAEVAKKYAPLGKEGLAQTLYDMKKSNEANYNAYITVLDEQLALNAKLEKSELFQEVGKSGSGSSAGGGVESKIETKAAEIMKADPNMDYTTAIAKAWEQSPDLLAEYDQEYRG